MVNMTGRLYNDPVDFNDSNVNKYPCNTQYMIYRPEMHRYILTEHALVQGGISMENFMGDEDRQRFLESVSKKIYDFIWQCVRNHQVYHVLLYRIATAPTHIYPSQYYMRKQFEEALVSQARFMVENEDPMRMSRGYIGSDGKFNPHMKDRNDGSFDISDISPESIRTLESLDLTRWFMVTQFAHLDKTKY